MTTDNSLNSMNVPEAMTAAMTQLSTQEQERLGIFATVMAYAYSAVKDVDRERKVRNTGRHAAKKKGTSWSARKKRNTKNR